MVVIHEWPRGNTMTTQVCCFFSFDQEKQYRSVSKNRLWFFSGIHSQRPSPQRSLQCRLVLFDSTCHFNLSIVLDKHSVQLKLCKERDGVITEQTLKKWMNALQSTIHCTQSDVMHEDKSFYINEEIHWIISITVSDKMLLIFFQFLLMIFTAEAFNVTLFKSHVSIRILFFITFIMHRRYPIDVNQVFNYYNYIRWVHNAPPLVEDKSLENGAYYWVCNQ